MGDWLHRQFPRAPREHPRQQHAHAQHAPGGHQVLLPLGRHLRARVRASLRAHPLDAGQAVRPPPRRFLSRTEVEALVDAPSKTTWTGRRDRVLLLVAVQTGLRVPELIALPRQDVATGPGAHLRCRGKGRKERCTPLRRDADASLTAWLREHPAGDRDPVFATVRGRPLSRDAVKRIVTKHVKTAATRSPSLANKRVTPHVLRHTAAMALLQHGVDRAVIALWLGHESVETTQIYLHADLKMKEAALSRTVPPDVAPGRYRPDDQLLAFLEGL